MESTIEVLYSEASPEFFLGLASKKLEEEWKAKENPAKKPNVKKSDVGKEFLSRSRVQNRESHGDQKKKNMWESVTNICHYILNLLNFLFSKTPLKLCVDISFKSIIIN